MTLVQILDDGFLRFTLHLFPRERHESICFPPALGQTGFFSLSLATIPEEEVIRIPTSNPLNIDLELHPVYSGFKIY